MSHQRLPLTARPDLGLPRACHSKAPGKRPTKKCLNIRVSLASNTSYTDSINIQKKNKQKNFILAARHAGEKKRSIAVRVYTVRLLSDQQKLDSSRSQAKVKRLA